jgi:methanogenic corrinoid protein MtbC1
MYKIGFNNTVNNKIIHQQPISTECKFTHSLILGKTGSGKTTSALLTGIKNHLISGHSILAFDEKNSLHLSLKAIASELKISNDRIFQLGNPEGIKVNIIKNYSEKRFHELSKMMIQESHDPFWAKAAQNMFVNTAMYMKSLKELFALLQCEFKRIGYYATNDKNTQNAFTWKKTADAGTFTPITIKIDHKPMVFNDIGQLFEDARQFVALCVNAENILEKVLEEFPVIRESKKMMKKYNEVKEKSLKLVNYTIKPDLSEASGNNGVFFMISSSITDMMADFLNDPYGKDINELLEQQQSIVIINTEALTMPITSNLLNTILSRFVPRAKLTSKRAVSVFIDEANRVLSPESDLYTDILREACIDVTLCVQNEAQMVEKFGAYRWIAFQQNFVNRISYANDTNGLKTFEYEDLITSNVYQATPIFFDKEVLMQEELEYQNSQDLYLHCRDTASEVVIFDKHLMEYDNKVIIYDVVSKEEFFRSYEENEEAFVDRLLAEFTTK